MKINDDIGLTLFDICLRVEKKIFKEIMHGHALAQEPLPMGSHEIYNFGRPFLGHHYYTPSLSEPCPWVQKKIFKEIYQFYTFYPKILPLGVGGGHEIYNFLSPYPTDATYQIWNWPTGSGEGYF